MCVYVEVFVCVCLAFICVNVTCVCVDVTFSFLSDYSEELDVVQNMCISCHMLSLYRQ